MPRAVTPPDGERRQNAVEVRLMFTCCCHAKSRELCATCRCYAKPLFISLATLRPTESRPAQRDENMPPDDIRGERATGCRAMRRC